MTVFRNEGTEAGRELWRKVDVAASHVPDWMKEQMRKLDRIIAEKRRATKRLTKELQGKANC